MPEELRSRIVPVFNEQEVLEESCARMDAAMRATGHPYEIIYVNDGSRDGTMSILRRIAAGAPQVRVLSFSRNFGHQLAVTCGMDAARGSALIIIDVDLQDPPELIPQMVERWKAGADIVYGKRLKREGETLFKKLTASVYYRLLSWMSAYPIPLDTGDFRLIDRRVADVFLQMREHNRFLRGMSAWMGFRSEPLEYERHERAADAGRGQRRGDGRDADLSGGCRCGQPAGEVIHEERAGRIFILFPDSTAPSACAFSILASAHST